jgi:hypothetical protein
MNRCAMPLNSALQYGGVYWDRTSRAVGAGFTVQGITIDASTPCLNYNTLQLCLSTAYNAVRRVCSKALSSMILDAVAGRMENALLLRIFRSTQRTPSSVPPVYFLEC